MKTYQHRIAVIVAAVWVIVLPFVWARFYSWAVACPYADILPRYRPDLAAGAAAVVLLPGAWMRKRWAGRGLIGAAVLLPVLKMTMTGPMPGTWMISTLLLLLAAWGTHFAIDAPSPDMKRLALRVLLTLLYGFAAIGTPPAYLHLAAGTFAGLEGIAEGKYFLGALLWALSLLALFAMWSLWSIGRCLWRHGAYTNAAREDRVNDARGLLCAWIALVGFNAIAAPLYRTDEVFGFSVLLAPAAVLATVAFFWSMRHERTGSPGDLSDASDVTYFRSLTKLADLPGVVCGVTIGLLGVFYLVPRPRSGWGSCDWTVLYPLHGSLWPVERPMIFDACSDDVWTLTFISSALSIVCLIAGASAAAIGKNASARRGAYAAAIVVTFVLARLVIHVSQTPDGPYIAWLSTLTVGAFVVAGGAWLGLVGGWRGALWKNNRARRADSSERWTR